MIGKFSLHESLGVVYKQKCLDCFVMQSIYEVLSERFENIFVLPILIYCLKIMVDKLCDLHIVIRYKKLSH